MNDYYKKPFSAKWLKDNIDMGDERLWKDVRLWIDNEDIISDERGEAGCIDIIYCSQLYCTVSKGLASEEWLVTISGSFRNDCWAPSIYTTEDFMRLFRVVAGFELPLRNL